MRSIKKRLALWHIVLIIGIAAIAIPVAARVGMTAKAVVNEPQVYLEQPTGDNDNADTKASEDSKDKKDSKANKDDAGRGVVPPQDDYYERRRQYWEKRVDRRLEYRDEYLDEQTGDNNDDADAKDSKNEVDDEDYVVDEDWDRYERRREYYREQLDEDW